MTIPRSLSTMGIERLRALSDTVTPEMVDKAVYTYNRVDHVRLGCNVEAMRAAILAAVSMVVNEELERRDEAT